MEYEQAELTIDVIGQGDLVERINEALQQVTRDIVARETVMKPRSITISIEITPDDSGTPEIKSKVRVSVPPAKALTTRGILRDGKILVNRFVADEPRQTVIENVVNINKK